MHTTDEVATTCSGVVRRADPAVQKALRRLPGVQGVRAGQHQPGRRRRGCDAHAPGWAALRTRSASWRRRSGAALSWPAAAAPPSGSGSTPAGSSSPRSPSCSATLPLLPLTRLSPSFTAFSVPCDALPARPWKSQRSLCAWLGHHAQSVAAAPAGASAAQDTPLPRQRPARPRRLAACAAAAGACSGAAGPPGSAASHRPVRSLSRRVRSCCAVCQGQPGGAPGQPGAGAQVRALAAQEFTRGGQGIRGGRGVPGGQGDWASPQPAQSSPPVQAPVQQLGASHSAGRSAAGELDASLKRCHDVQQYLHPEMCDLRQSSGMTCYLWTCGVPGVALRACADSRIRCSAQTSA